MPEHPARFNCCIRSKDNQEEADTGALMHFRLCLHVSNILMKTRQLWMEIEGLRGWCGWHAAEFLCLARHFINFRHVSDDNEDTSGRWIGGGRWPGNVGANQAQPAPSQNFLYGGGKTRETRVSLPHCNEAWNVVNVLLPFPKGLPHPLHILGSDCANA